MTYSGRFIQFVSGSVSRRFEGLWLSKGIYVPFSGSLTFVFLVHSRRCSATGSCSRSPPNIRFLAADKPLYLPHSIIERVDPLDTLQYLRVVDLTACIFTYVLYAGNYILLWM